MILLNGGAIVTALTYLGHSADQSLASGARLPLGLFALGLTLAVLSAFFGYECQLTLYNEDRGNQLKRDHMFWQRRTVASLALSLAFFVAGAFTAIAFL